MNYSNSEIYEGSWNDGNYHGTGELIYENIGSMHGQWQQGVLADDSASKVMQSSPSGEYTGQIINEKPDGEGTMLYTNGRVDQGTWEQGFLVYGKADYTASAAVN